MEEILLYISQTKAGAHVQDQKNNESLLVISLLRYWSN